MDNIIITPTPKKFEHNSFILLGKLSSVKWRVSCDIIDNELICEAAENIRIAFCESFASNKESDSSEAFKVLLKLSCFDECKSTEAYKIEVTQGCAILSAPSPSGLYWASQTFGYLLKSDGQNAYIAECSIFDYPEFKHRGLLQETRFGSEFLSLDDWYDIIDTFSSLKLNELTIAVYGCWNIQYDMSLSEYSYLPLKNTPKLKSKHNIKYYSIQDKKWVYKEGLEPEMYKQDYLNDIIKYAKRKNVHVKPLFNSLGHNMVLPREYPEISAIGEDGRPKGFGLCLTSPETRKRMFAIYDEIIDRYLKPNGIDSIHIGLDEYRPEYNVNKDDVRAKVSQICHCEKCKSIEYSELIFNYTTELVRYLKSKGMKSVHIYHDMYFGGDFTDKHFIDKIKSEKLDDTVVVEWWDYERESDEIYYRGHKENVNADLRSLIKPMCGYYPWSIPNGCLNNIRASSKLAKKIGAEGIDAYSIFEDSNDFNYEYISQIAWNGEDIDDESILKSYADKHFNSDSLALDKLKSALRIFTKDNFNNYLVDMFEYYFNAYMNPKTDDFPRNFPANVFKAISNDENKYLPYLEYVKAIASDCLCYFETLAQQKSFNIWRLILKQYYTLSNEYLTLYKIEKEFEAGYITDTEISKVLAELIAKREELMLLAENVRRKSTMQTYLRNASIIRQYLIDFKAYVDLCIKKNEKVIIDLKNPPFSGSEIFFALR